MLYLDLDKTTVSSFSIKKCSFLKRLMIVCLAFILAFNTAISKPKEVEAFPVAFATIVAVVTFTAAVTTIVCNSEKIINWFSDKKDMNESEILDYYNEHVSVDGDGNYLMDNSIVLVLNEFKSDMEEEAEVYYMYGNTPAMIQPSSFYDRATYDAIMGFINANENLIYWLYSSNNEYYLAFTDADLGGVYDFDADNIPMSAIVDLYDIDTWSSLQNAEISVLSFAPTRYSGCKYFDSNGSVTSCSYDEFLNLSLSDLEKNARGITWTGAQFFCRMSRLGLYHQKDLYPNFYINSAYSGQHATLITYRSGGIPVFKTFDSFKNGTTGRPTIQLLPDYQPGAVVNNVVTPSQVQQVENIIYPNGVPSDPGDSGGGSGSGSDDSGGGFLSTFLSALKGLGNALLGILSVIIDFFAGFIELITKPLTDLVNVFKDVTTLIPSGFVDFLSALFPFVPEEWVTMCGAFLAVALFGSILAFFLKR